MDQSVLVSEKSVFPSPLPCNLGIVLSQWRKRPSFLGFTSFQINYKEYPVRSADLYNNARRVSLCIDWDSLDLFLACRTSHSLGTLVYWDHDISSKKAIWMCRNQLVWKASLTSSLFHFENWFCFPSFASFEWASMIFKTPCDHTEWVFEERSPVLFICQGEMGCK